MSTLSPIAPLRACWKTGKERRQPVNHNCRAETLFTLSCERCWKYSGKQKLHKFLKEATGITVKFSPQEVALNFVPSSPYARPRKKVLLINCRKSGLIWSHVLLPLLHKWRWGTILDLLQRAVNETRHFFTGEITMICCCWGVNKMVGIWNRNIYHRQNNKTSITHCLMWRVKFDQKQNVEAPWNNTIEFLGNLVELIRNYYVTIENSKVKHYGKTYIFQDAQATNETSSMPSGPGRITGPSFPSKHHNYKLDKYDIVVIHKKGEDPTTRLTQLSFRLVSLRYETINGKTPVIIVTTSTRYGMVRSFVRMVFLSAGWDDIQSRVSAPFFPFTKNSVNAKPSKLPNTLEVVRRRQRLKKRLSKFV